MSLLKDAEDLAAENRVRAAAARAEADNKLIERMREYFVYATGGEKPESVTLEGKMAVAVYEGMRFVYELDGSTPTIHRLVRCDDCGVEFTNYSTRVGAGMNNYGPSHAKPAEERRAAAVEALAKQLAEGKVKHGCERQDVVAKARGAVDYAARVLGTDRANVLRLLSQ